MCISMALKQSALVIYKWTHVIYMVHFNIIIMDLFRIILQISTVSMMIIIIMEQGVVARRKLTFNKVFFNLICTLQFVQLDIR